MVCVGVTLAKRRTIQIENRCVRGIGLQQCGHKRGFPGSGFAFQMQHGCVFQHGSRTATGGSHAMTSGRQLL